MGSRERLASRNAPPRLGSAVGTPFWLLSALALSVSACTGLVENPGGPCVGCIDGQNPGVPGGSPGGAPGAGSPGGTTAGTDTPMGIGDPTTPDGVGYASRFPKLSNAQWERTVQDLLRLSAPSGLSADFTQEPGDKGYDTVAAATLTVSGDAWSRYQTAAEKLAEQVTADAAKLAKITPTGTFANDAAKAQTFIDSFGKRAFRRPLSSDEKAAYLALYNQGPALVGGTAFNAGVRLVLEAMLQSPSFLYRVETAATDSAAEQKAWLSGHEVATRLSYALWGTMPSDELLAAASAGELDSKEGVVSWAGKLLDSPRARQLLLSFHEQTFSTSVYGTQDKDPALGFDAAALAPIMRSEATKFFEHVIDTAGGIEQLLTEPVAFVNEDTAPFYGVTGVTGKELQKRDLDPATRAGLFTQLGFLTKNATRNGSDPVHRGLAVLRKLLCDEPDPPPMMFSLPAPEPGLTTRETYEKFTACGGTCHREMINPPGFAFEVFDGVGKVRSSEVGKPIDATGTLVLRDGFTLTEKKASAKTDLSFDGPVDLLSKLAATPRVHECYARNFMKFLLAREVDPVERGASSSLADGSLSAGSMRALILQLVALDTFRSRVSDPL